MISLPLWFQLYYYMISHQRFVISFEEDLKRIDQPSGDLKQNGDSDVNIKCSNINEINTQEHSHSSEETRDSRDPVSNQSFKTTRSKSDKLIDLDIKKTESTAEFVYSKNGNIVTYTAKEGYGFYLVKEGKSWWKFLGSDKDIWEAGYRSQYLNKVVIETSPKEEKILTIHCVDGTTAVFKKVKDGDFTVQNEQISDDSKPADSSAVTEAPTAEPSSEEGHSQVSEDTKDSTNSDPQQKLEDSSPIIHKLIILDITTNKTTSEVVYSKHNNLVSYRPRRIYAFFSVKEGRSWWKVWGSEKVIWNRINKSEYSHKVDIISGSNDEETLTIHLVDGTTKVFKKVKDGDFLPTSEVKLVEVDIEKTKNTTEFNYSKEINVVTYTPKEGYGFGTVKIGKGWKVWASDKVFWEAENKSEYSNKVVVESGSNDEETLTIHLVDGTTKVFKKVKDGDFLLTSEVKLVEVDIEKTKNTTEFNYSKEINVVTYTPKEGYGFGTVKIGKGWKVWASDKVFWEAENKSEYSNKVVVESGSNDEETLTIHLVDGTTKVFKKVKDGDFLPTSEVKLVEVDIEKTKNTTEFNYSKEINVVTYTPKEGYGFGTVKIGKGWKVWASDKVFWEAENKSEYSNKVVVESGSNDEETLTIHLVDGTTKVFKKVKDGDFIFQNEQASQDSIPVDSSPFTEAPTDEPNSEQEPTETPEETKDSADPVSQESENLEPLDSLAVADAPTAEPTSEEEPTETPGETRDPTDLVSEQKSETASPEVKLVEVDIEKTKNTTEFNYSKEINVVTYTPKEGYGFGTVKIGKGWKVWASDKVFWEAENKSEYSNKVVVESGSNDEETLTIHLVDGTTKVFKKVKDGDFSFQNDDSSKGSKPVDSSGVKDVPTTQPSSEQEPSKTPGETKDSTDPVSKKTSEVELVDLDITKTEGTTEFHYSSEGKVSTYTAKEGYGFGTVKKGKGSCSCTRSDEIIWESKDKTQASNKVRLTKGCDGTNTTLCILEIYMVDESTLRYFNSDSVNSPYFKKWVQKFEDVPKESHPAQIKIYTKDETDEPVENDTTKYKVNIFNEGQSSKYFYIIKKNVKCTQVKYNNNEIWNDTQDKDHKTIHRLILNTGDKCIVLEYNGYAFKTYKIPDEPKQK